MIKLIVARSTNGIIGVGDKLPWSIAAEMAHFKRETTSWDSMLQNVVVMGSKTWDSIPSRYRPLIDRTNVVLTRDDTREFDGAIPVSSIEQFVQMFSPKNANIFVIGGADIYEQFLKLDLIDEVVMSEVNVMVKDSLDNVYLAGFHPQKFSVFSREQHERFTVVRYRKT